MAGKNKVFNVDVAFAFLVAGVIVVLLFPMPTMVLDVLLTCNLALSLVIFLIMFYMKSPLEMSSFPTILLITTLFRLSLNVASTKLVLLDANAGVVIDAFGKFVIQNNYIIGAVVFCILMAIQFMVITKGATRISEVAARFTLDAMPGKQMSIDADLNAGIIDEEEAKKKRLDLSREAEFYGSMDGASKFVQGDVKAGLVITAINIIGGISIGVLQKGMPVTDALQVYTSLTIGDGLVSQIPALLISVASGLLVAKTDTDKDGLGGQLMGEMFTRPEPLFIGSSMLFVLAVLPGFPFLPFFTIAGACAMGGVMVNKMNVKKEEQLALASGSPAAKGGKALPGGKEQGKLGPGEPGKNQGILPNASDNSLPKINPMTLEVGFSLVPLVDTEQGGDLVERISLIRKQIKEELGFLIPPISIQDNIELANNEYRVLVRGLERGRGNVHAGSHLAINPGDATGKIEGVRTVDPAFGFEAVWINKQRVEAAESMGYTVVDPSSVVATHVTKIVKDYAAELISRQDVSNILDEIKKTSPAVVEELSTHQLSVGVVHRVLQSLLTENVPVHDMPVILETLADYSPQTRDPIILSEFCRQALKGHIVSKYLNPNDQTLYAVTLQPEVEEEIQTGISHGGGGGMLGLAPERVNEIVNCVNAVYDTARGVTDADIVLLVSPLIRLHMRRILERKIYNMAVMSYAEVSDDVSLKIVGTARPSGARRKEGKLAA